MRNRFQYYSCSKSGFSEIQLLPSSSFGIEQNNRSFNSNSGRYGYQSQEKDNEIKGQGNSVNFTFRMYDSRLGKFLSIDPLYYKFPFYSPYQFSSNSPILTGDLEGLETKYLLNYPEASITIEKGPGNNWYVRSSDLDKIAASNYSATDGNQQNNTIVAGQTINVISVFLSPLRQEMKLKLPTADVTRTVPVLKPVRVLVERGKAEHYDQGANVADDYEAKGVEGFSGGGVGGGGKMAASGYLVTNGFETGPTERKKAVDLFIANIKTANNANLGSGKITQITLELNTPSKKLENDLKIAIETQFGITPTINPGKSKTTTDIISAGVKIVAEKPSWKKVPATADKYEIQMQPSTEEVTKPAIEVVE